MTKNIVIGVLVVAALVLGYFAFFGASHSLGTAQATGPQHYQIEAFLQGLQIGQRTTPLSAVSFTSCNLIGSDASQAASSTLAYDCAVPGITSAFNVIANLASTTPRGGSSSWEITGAKASSTPGYATVLLTNNGPAAVPSATSVGSSTSVFVFR